MLINYSNLLSSIDLIEQKFEHLYSDTIQPDELTACSDTLTKIQEFIQFNFEELFIQDVDPVVLQERVVVLQSMLNLTFDSLKSTNSHSQTCVAASSSSRTEDSHRLITGQNLEYEQTRAQDLKNSKIESYRQTLMDTLSQIQNEYAENSPQKFSQLSKIFEDTILKIDSTAPCNELFTRESIFPVLNQVYTEYKTSFDSLKNLAAKEMEIEKKNEIYKRFLAALQSDNKQEVDQLFDQLEKSDQEEIVTRLNFPLSILRNTPRLPRRPFSDWQTPSRSYDAEATATILQGMIDPGTENYRIYAEHSNDLLTVLNKMESYLFKHNSCSSPSAACSSSSQPEINDEIINVLVALVDEESISDRTVVDWAKGELLVEKNFPNFSRYLASNKKKLKVTMQGGRPTRILREALIQTAIECAREGLHLAKENGESLKVNFFVRVLQTLDISLSAGSELT